MLRQRLAADVALVVLVAVRMVSLLAHSTAAALPPVLAVTDLPIAIAVHLEHRLYGHISLRHGELAVAADTDVVTDDHLPLLEVILPLAVELRTISVPAAAVPDVAVPVPLPSSVTVTWYVVGSTTCRTTLTSMLSFTW